MSFSSSVICFPETALFSARAIQLVGVTTGCPTLWSELVEFGSMFHLGFSPVYVFHAFSTFGICGKLAGRPGQKMKSTKFARQRQTPSTSSEIHTPASAHTFSTVGVTMSTQRLPNATTSYNLLSDLAWVAVERSCCIACCRTNRGNAYEDLFRVAEFGIINCALRREADAPFALSCGGLYSGGRWPRTSMPTSACIDPQGHYCRELEPMSGMVRDCLCDNEETVQVCS